jgi:hypothetical protein
MATGRLGAANLTAGSLSTVYQCPSDTFAIVAVNFLNRGNQAQTFRLAVALADTPNANGSEWIEYDVEVLSKGVLERTGLVLAASQRLVAYASGGNASVVVYGIETSTA